MQFSCSSGSSINDPALAENAYLSNIPDCPSFLKSSLVRGSKNPATFPIVEWSIFEILKRD
ncbi:hypothetical protein PPL_04617 [Heterostelium album PN500]|uniref:Uncharacterized protein n=1 Tax=Heterostelium pallidum (strain ATCC 26659 / Pp 5 / PN500) TaxID=670386 RepID=D3B827_HETP5|nr:hypothetical protein PPL_04617 [Heterostelium album PN500]EFA82195.1 hypothetical protein PPL_04617 [Heterostelium album PN500]|eukprot:XP_020434312.1 hypothetical protein PPL_04617 [Heterostelium album PN500]